MKKTIHCFVSGRVQGVCFRMYTQKEAAALGLTGWVRNLPDGRVEVMASGEEEQLNQLQEWLKQGPEMAKVTKIDLKNTEYQDFDVFSIK